MGGAAKFFDLAGEIVTTAEDFDKNLFGTLGETEELFADLFGEFACGSDDDALDLRRFGVHLHQQGQAESGGFPGAGLGLCDEVAAILDEEGDGLELDGGGVFDAKFFDALDQVFWDAEFGKSFQSRVVVEL